MYVRQTDITAAKFECQLLVVDAQLMQHRGVDVVDLQRVFGNGIAEFVQRNPRAVDVSGRRSACGAGD